MHCTEQCDWGSIEDDGMALLLNSVCLPKYRQVSNIRRTLVGN